MPNHFHLLIEMKDDLVSRIMQRVLIGYSQYHNGKYKKIGHSLSRPLQVDSLSDGSVPGGVGQIHPFESGES